MSTRETFHSRAMFVYLKLNATFIYFDKKSNPIRAQYSFNRKDWSEMKFCYIFN